MRRRPDSTKACPRCGGGMDEVGTWDGRYNANPSDTTKARDLNRRTAGKYGQCVLCGHWENRGRGASTVRSVGNIGGQLNFDNEDGWPCR